MLYEMFQTLVDEGDKVALIDLVWVSYEAMTELAGRSFTRVDTTLCGLRPEAGLEDLQTVVPDETDLLVVNSSTTHTGVCTDAALRGVGDLPVEHDVTLQLRIPVCTS